MVILTPPLKGRWEVASLAMNDCGQGHPHPISKKEGGEFAMTSTLLPLIGRRMWSWPPSSSFQREGVKIAMTNAVLLEKWLTVIMAFLILLAMTPTLLFLRSEGLWSRSSSSQFLEGRWGVCHDLYPSSPEK